MKSISTEEALLLAWKSCLHNKKIIAISSALGIGAYFFVFGSLFLFTQGYGITLFFAFIFYIIATILQVGFIKITLNISGNKTVTLALIVKSYKLFVRHIAGCVFYLSVVLIGLILGVLPGVIWAVQYSLWPFVMVNKNVDVLTSFKESKRITKGHCRTLYVLYASLIGGVLVSIIPLGIGLLISYPVALLTVAYVYRKLQIVNTGTSLRKKTKKKKIISNPY